MKRIFFWIITLSIVAAGAIALFWERAIPPQFSVPPHTEPVPEKKAVPAIAYPLPGPVDGASAMPALDGSDSAFLNALANVQRQLGELMFPERIIRNIVVTVDNLPREVVAARMRPVKPAPGKFLISQDGGKMHISPANAERYRAYIRIVEATDPERLVAAYVRFYPLFQKAYQELGYPNQYFNDRLVAVIDHLLDAPELDTDPELAQPRVLYEFAVPQLQHASAGHKVMMRIGPENAKRLKVRLKTIREHIVAASDRVRAPQ